ncbi:MAG: enolase C-terminal domain-like protein [Lachnospiraceae bacterium]
MNVTKITEKTVNFGSSIANSYINFSQMTGSVVVIETDVVRNGKPVTGYGFNSIGRYAPTSIIRDRMIPKLLDAGAQIYNDDRTNLNPENIYRILKSNEKPGGHGDRAHAVGAIDMAVWDTIAKIEEKPLYQVLGERYNNNIWDQDVYTYGAGGYYYESDSSKRIKDELQSYINMGFRDVKMKIGGADLKTDLERIEAALTVVNGDGSRLMVDANGRYDLKEALECALAIKGYELKWYEEPLDPLDFSSHAAVAEYYPGAIATGENLFSYQDAKNLFRHGGLRADRDYIQIDCPLSYGLIEYMKILELMKDNGWSNRNCIPHGGNLFSLHIAAGLQLGGNECYPGVFQPFGGFADDIPVINSLVKLPEIHGIGFEAKSNLWELLNTI